MAIATERATPWVPIIHATKGMTPEQKSHFLWYETYFPRPVVHPSMLVEVQSLSEPCTSHFVRSEMRGSEIIWTCDCTAAQHGRDCWHVHSAKRAWWFGRIERYEAATGCDWPYDPEGV